MLGQFYSGQSYLGQGVSGAVAPVVFLAIESVVTALTLSDRAVTALEPTASLVTDLEVSESLLSDD